METFSSNYPIIPGVDHGVLGPSWASLRAWALHKYSNLISAETNFPASAQRMRPVDHWPHGISDGACFDAAHWAESAPKIYPIMTDCRWHYFFSYHNHRIRAHIVPRVCLWNPYNRALRIPDLSVLMPNPFYLQEAGVHFFVENQEVARLKKEYPDPHGAVFNWMPRSGYMNEHGVNMKVFKVKVNPFPPTRFLGFTLKSATLAPGECHVFSPQVNSELGYQKYHPDNIAANILSSSSAQGTAQYYYDPPVTAKYRISPDSSLRYWRILPDAARLKLRFNKIFAYQPELGMSVAGKVESFPFILKVGTSGALDELYTSSQHPTLQLINNAAGGVYATTAFDIKGAAWGSSDLSGFGNLEVFEDSLSKTPAATHQIGAKLLWLDESFTEGRNPPLRLNSWKNDHMALNVCPIANWNVRAALTTRSPVSQCALKYYMNSTGPWLLQFVPLSPQDFNDLPSLNRAGNAYIKNPFGAAVTFASAREVVLFDLPSPDYGVLSLAALRHAMISPYSWTPTYIVGHSLRDMHAPAERTAHRIAVEDFTGSFPSTRWDYLIGGAKNPFLNHGPYAKEIDSQGLLQIGTHAVTHRVEGRTLSSANEVLAYDIAYEVNHNLWDTYWISGMPLNENADAFAWDPHANKKLWNRHYGFNADSGENLSQVVSKMAGSDALNQAFWRNAEFLKNRAAFNVNSTSVDAWVAVLSGTLGLKRPLASGTDLAGDVLSFSRYKKPFQVARTDTANPGNPGGWSGARQLSQAEVRSLASHIVFEVKRRGPFISLADFVNRRLVSDQDETSRMGALDAAIEASGLNKHFTDNPEFKTTSINAQGGAGDNNLADFRQSYRYSVNGAVTTVQPKSQAWGMPGFLMQSDVLEPLAPLLSVRGDTFTIRAYGEARSGLLVKSRAWLEAVVERVPHYMEHRDQGSPGPLGDEPIAAPLRIHHATGEYTQGDLKWINQKFGRRFVIKSFRWLAPSEI